MGGPPDTDLISYCVILSVALLGISLTIFGLCSLVKAHHTASVYLINLFISDLIQTSANILEYSSSVLCLKIRKCNFTFEHYAHLVYTIGVVLNIFFMVLISAERYIIVAYPVWYRNTYKNRMPVYVSITVWILVSVSTIIFYFISGENLFVGALVVLLFPYPFVIFFFVGTWRAISRNTTLPPDEQKRIMRILGLVLFIYTILFLPTMVSWLRDMFQDLLSGSWHNFINFANILLALNPLFDFLIYLIVRKDAKDILSSVFFCFSKRQEDSRMTETTSEARV